MNTTICPAPTVAGFGEKDVPPFTPVMVMVMALVDGVDGALGAVGVLVEPYPPPPPQLQVRSIAPRTDAVRNEIIENLRMNEAWRLQRRYRQVGPETWAFPRVPDRRVFRDRKQFRASVVPVGRLLVAKESLTAA